MKGLFQLIFTLISHTDISAKLYFDQLQFSFRDNGMLAPGSHGHNVARLDWLFHAVNDGPAYTRDYRPDLVPAFVAVVVHHVTWIKCDLHRHRIFLYVENPVTSPAFLCKHDLLVYGIDKGLDIGTLLFIRD